MVWKCVYGVAPAYLSDLRIPATAISGRQHLRSAATGTLLVPHAWTATGQRSFAVKFNGPAIWNRLPPGTSTTVTGPVGERLQAGTNDAPVHDCPAPLRRLHDFGAGYKYSDLFTYLHNFIHQRMADTKYNKIYIYTSGKKKSMNKQHK